MVADMTVQRQEAWVPVPPSQETFAGRLRLLRLALDDISAEDMARRIDVPATTYRSWESGREPRRMGQVVRAIHDATGVDMSWLMGWGVSPGTPTEQGDRSFTCGVEDSDVEPRRTHLRLVSGL